MVGLEAAILKGHQQSEKPGVHIPDLHQQAPAAIGHGESPQQAALAVHRHDRAFGGGGDVKGSETLDEAPEPCGRHHQQPRRQAEGASRPPPAPLLSLPRRLVHQRCSLTSSAPEAVRPKRCGRYMSSMVAGGST